MIIARNRAPGAVAVGVEYPLIASIFGVLTSGIASETFRTPMFWITLGCCCAWVRANRTANAAAIRPASAPAQAPALRR